MDRVVLAEAQRQVALPLLDRAGMDGHVIKAVEYFESAARDAHPIREGLVGRDLGMAPGWLGTLLRAQATAREKQLDQGAWRSIAEVAPSVRGWRYRETLAYVSKIEAYLAGLKAESP